MLYNISFNRTASCRKIRSRFSEYVDGMLPDHDRVEVHEHLKNCRGCSEDLDQLCGSLALLADFREECLPDAVRSYRLPRATFVQIFPSIQKERPPLTLDMFVPYVCALIFMFAVLSTWDFWEKRDFREHYTPSNYVEVVAKI